MDIRRAIRNALGAGSDIDLKARQDALQSIQIEHRLDSNLNDFFVARMNLVGGGVQKIDIDSYWTSSGITCPAGYRHVSIYSRKCFSYPIAMMRTKLVTLAAGVNNWFGVELGGGGHTSFAALHEVGAVCVFNIGGYLFDAITITSLLPATYDTAEHIYWVKVNKCNAELHIDGVLKAVGLFNLPEAIPNTWDDQDPYALGSTRQSLGNIAMPAFVEVDALGAEITLPLDPTDNYFTAADGDPLPPRQYALYNENTTTKWNAQAIAVGTITSHPVPVWGYPNKTVHFQANGAGSLDMEFYVGGAWRVAETIPILANTLMVRVIDSEQPIIRFVFDPDAYPTTVNAAEVYIS
ncbi:hypothetical protein ES703_88754 [subsurface metagenome]